MKSAVVFYIGVLFTVFSLGSAQAQSQDGDANKQDDSGVFMEEVIVQGERGLVDVLERPMTITAFNAGMIEQLGMTGPEDLEQLVPGLQMGHQGEGTGKGEVDHIYLRGIGTQRSWNFMQDVGVATYVDGVFSDEQYGLAPPGFFDVASIEVARGPQGTTGGKPAIAGAIYIRTEKPGDTFDLRVLTEFTDQSTQRVGVAFGGPLGNTNFSYRLTGSYMGGDGAIENLGDGPDASEPDVRFVSPQLSFRNDRVDINLRYSRQDDEGTPSISLPLSGRDVVTACLLEGTGPNGETVCISPNPFFGAGQAPSVAGCAQANDDGSFSGICDGGDLNPVIETNVDAFQDNYVEMVSLGADFVLTDNLKLLYRFGDRTTETHTLNDIDYSNRQGGGVCPAGNPAGLPAGTVSMFCALDGLGGGQFGDARQEMLRQSEYLSHEISIVSSNAGSFNFVAGLYYSEGERGFSQKTFNFGSSSQVLHQDNNATCEAIIPFFGTLLRDVGPSAGTSAVFDCPGMLPDFSMTGQRGPDSGNVMGNDLNFFNWTTTETMAAYFNGDYRIDERWLVYGGVRYDRDEKSRPQEGYRFTFDGGGFGADIWAFRDQNVPGFEPKNGAEWSDVTWNIGFEYTPDDATMVYSRISKGYRAGGFASFGETRPALLTFDAESLINYEVGIKGRFLDNRVQLQTSAFYQDYDKYWADSQTILPVELRIGGNALSGGFEAIEGTWMAGLEIEGGWSVNDRLTVRGFYNFLDSELGNLVSVYCCDASQPTEPVEFEGPDGNTFTQNISVPQSFEGNRLPNQARHKLSGTLDYQMPISASLGTLNLLTSFTYTGEKHPDQSNLDAFIIPSHTRWDIRASWVAVGGNLDATLWVQNLLDEVAVQQWAPVESNGLAPIGTVVDERRIGVTVNWRM